MTFELSTSEFEALWNWHHEQQYEMARQEKYSDAEWHKKRAKEVRAEIDRLKYKQIK